MSMADTKRLEAQPAAPVSKENARLRLYLLGIVLDMWAMLGSFVLANWLVLGSPLGEPEKPHGIVIFAVLAPIYALLAINGGAYGIRMLGAARISAAHALWAFVQAAMLTLLIIFLAKIGDQISRLTFLVGGVFSFFALVACRYGMTALSRRILGAVPRVEMFIADGVETPHIPAHMAFVDARKARIDPTKHDAKMAEKLARAVGGAEHVVVACPSERIEDWTIALKSLSARGEILVPEMARFAPVRGGTFQHHPTLIVAGGPLDFRQRIIKRLFDVIVSLGAIIALSPVLLITAIAVKLTSPGPILFKQARLGRDARPFRILKFRSMRAEMSDHNASQLTQKNDPRITPIGAFIRKTSIDELPQLFNVLIGDMSIVGPRPPIPTEVEKYTWWQRRRISVKPGLTCVWQVYGRNRVSFKRWVEMDLYYIDNWSLWLDLKLIAHTVRVVLRGTGM